MRKSKDTAIQEHGDLRAYFSMIPHLVDDAELDVYAYRLYGHLKRLARQGHEVEASTRELADHCRMSTGKVSDAKNTLIGKKLIDVVNDGYRDKIILLDVWRENMLRYANEGHETRSPHEQDSKTRSPGEHVEREREANQMQTRSPREQDRSPDERVSETRSPHEQTRSPGERHNEYIYKNTSKKEEEGIVGAAPTAPAAPPTAWDELVNELCTTCYGHTQREVLTEWSRGALLKEAKIIREAGFGVRDLPRWFDQVWRKDFRWVKNKQLPRPYEVRESLPRLARAGDYAVELPPAAEVPETAVEDVPSETPSAATVPAGDDWSTALADMRVQIPDLVDGPLAGSRLQEGGMFMGRPLWYVVIQGDDDAVCLQRRAKALIERTLSVQLRSAVYVEIVPARVFASTGEQA